MCLMCCLLIFNRYIYLSLEQVDTLQSHRSKKRNSHPVLALEAYRSLYTHRKIGTNLSAWLLAS